VFDRPIVFKKILSARIGGTSRSATLNPRSVAASAASVWEIRNVDQVAKFRKLAQGFNRLRKLATTELLAWPE
jgi:hypothetical protein